MTRFYWRVRAAWARWRTRKNPRPSTDEILRRIGVRGFCTCDFDPSYSGGLCDVCGLPESDDSARS